MSPDRTNNTARSLKPTAASRVPRVPLTPRTAGGNATTPSTKLPTLKTPSTAQSEPPRVTPKVRQQDSTPVNGALAAGNVTPRSSTRTSRVDSSHTTPTQDDTPSAPRPRSVIGTSYASAERKGIDAGFAVSGAQQVKAKVGRPNSFVSDNRVGRAALSSVRSGDKSSTDSSIDSRFFHASDVQKQEPPPKRPIQKKTPTFFYANEQQEQRPSQSPSAGSPLLSAVPEKRTSGPWTRADGTSNPSRTSPMLSPALSALSNTSSFFLPPTSAQHTSRSPSPSKENIHLSYRKGASQIFGTRPTPRSSEASSDVNSGVGERRGSVEQTLVSTPHRKSPSLSSIDSGNSHQSRRRSTTNVDGILSSSPLTQEVKSATVPRTGRPPSALPSIDTSLDPPTANIPSIPESARSPAKSVVDLAADARRERKVLDLEISNSSLLAINSSLEREVRRQKAELKRFRRLSRAGRFSVAPAQRTARFSEGLSVLGEEDVGDEDYSAFGPPSGFTDVYDDFSDEDEESVTSGGEPLSPTAQNDRLADDERLLRVDLEKHKELLVQSQMMNQTLKRCMYTTEEMIKDGKKALQYHVRVSDVKLGGRILSGHEDESEEEGEQIPEIQAEDELTLHADDAAKGFLDVWSGVGILHPDVSSDRDSAIEVDKPPFQRALTAPESVMEGRILLDSGRPPDGGVNGLGK